MEGLRFKPIPQDTDDRERRSDYKPRSAATRKYSNDSLPPSSSSSNKNNNNNNNNNNSIVNSNSHSYRRNSRSSFDSNSSNDGSYSNRNVDREDRVRHNHHHQHRNDVSYRNSTDYSTDENGESINGGHRSLLNRRSSSAMRVRELRDVLTSMTSSQEEEEGQEMKGSQKARLLVASQQRLMSRLQDLSHQLDSMDSEVTRVKRDIVNSRRYFSAMTGIPYGPEWPTSRQMDSAYTSPSSFVTSPGSSDESPCPSDTDWPSAPSLAATSSPTPEIRVHNGHSRAIMREQRNASVHNGASSLELEHRRLHTASPRLSSSGKKHQPSRSEDFSATHSCSHPSSHLNQHRPRPDHHHRHHKCMLNTELDTSGNDYKENRSDRLAQLESPFQSLADFDDAADASFTPGSVTEGRDSSGMLNGGFLLTRSDSCSSFMSWRSDVEMASLFPEEADSSSHTKCIAK